MSRFVKLKSLCKRITDGSHYSPIGIEKGIPMLSVKDMRENGFDYSNCKFISNHDYTDMIRNDCKPLLNDVLIAKDGSYLKHVFVIKEEINQAVLSSIGILRPNLDLVDPSYLKYYLQTKSVKQTVAKKYVSGSALPRIILKNFGEIDVLNPNLSIQRQIAAILSALDDKIELNNKINTELEQMAKTIYDYWFVQFDFPNAGGKPYKSSGGKMVYNDVLKREIPEGWEVEQIDDLGTIVGGSTPSKAIEENFTQFGMPWITPKDLSMNVGNKFIAKGELDVSERGLKEASLNILDERSVLMSSRAPVGYLAINRIPCTTNQGFKSIICNKEYSCEYVFYVLGQYMPTIEANATGSTFKEISASVFKGIKIIKPKKEVVQEFIKKIKPVFQKQENIEEQNQQLSSLRDWLLPMLMNGQIKVEEIDGDKTSKLNISDNRKSFAKQVLGGKIVSLFKDDPNFTHIKFQKLQFLAEHIAEVDLNLNYYFQAAGPYDNRFMHTIAHSFKKSKWFDKEHYKYISLEKQEQIEGYYQGYFNPVADRLDKLFFLLANATEAEAEIIATVYAVWNNRIILKQPIAEEALIKDFYNWSDRKHQYTQKQVLEGLQWLKTNDMEPQGFGKEIKRAKNTK